MLEGAFALQIVFHLWKTCVRLSFLEFMSETRAKPKQKTSELESPIWSVISFERCEASGLTYSEAADKIRELEFQKVSGLCIVTTEAASRVTS